MEDYIIRATAGNGSIRAFAATTRNTVEKARQVHNTTPLASAALGRMLTAAAIMGTMLKGEKDLLTLQIRGDGPIQGIVVTADNNANVKGYVFEPNVELPPKYPGKLDVGSAVGSGYLSVIKDIGLKEPYVGKSELINGEIAEDLTYYFAKSEQIPSTVGLGVLVDIDTHIKQAGGFIVQLLPDADEKMIQKLEQNLSEIDNVTNMLDKGMTPENILEKLLGNMDLNINEKLPVQFYCNCSRERVEKALISVGLEDLEKIYSEDKKASLHCHFCNEKYNFSEEDLKNLIEEAITK